MLQFSCNTIWARREATQSSMHAAKSTTFTGSWMEMTSQLQSSHPFPVTKQSGSTQNWFKPDLSIPLILPWLRMKFWIGMSKQLWMSKPMLSTLSLELHTLVFLLLSWTLELSRFVQLRLFRRQDEYYVLTWQNLTHRLNLISLGDLINPDGLINLYHDFNWLFWSKFEARF